MANNKLVNVSLSLAFVLGAWSSGALAQKKKEAAPAVAQPATAKPVETSPVTTIELEAKMVDGRKTWLPTTVSAMPGKVVFHLKNSFPEPHGFNIPGILPKPLDVPANGTLEVVAEFPKAGTYDLVCHLHPAHVKSVLTVK